MTGFLSEPLRLPCGATLKNRIAKGAMTEGLADPHNRATARHQRLYRRWAEGGAGLLLTGNVQIDRRALERPGNVVIAGEQSADALAALRDFAKAGTVNGTHLFMQLSHAGRQTPKAINPHPPAPSAVKLGLPGGNFGVPRAMRGDEIADVIARFAHAARIARETGFTGVQVHAAHGYLLSEFLSPRSNLRTDEWGGSLENRARLLLETVKAVRAAVGDDFPVAVKLNSADFQKDGFSHEDCLQVVASLNALSIDLLEISGGTYEQPRMMGASGLEPVFETGTRASTRAREAYFLEYAASIAKVAQVPLMVTGGFRTKSGMEEALKSGEVDVIGLARPLCVDPAAPQKLMEGRLEVLPSLEKTLRLGPGWLSGNSPFNLIKLLNAMGVQGWFCLQIQRLAEGQDPDLGLGVFQAFRRYMAAEQAAATALAR
ncbi:MAG: NADH:flavin oxidoreductase/NADH oxidase family protein [Alphaproteobacteria bacterium]|nr:NADH:flavin oxidoreductase/NADH oxidase family protein [Alphaproteobacteria bacterium]